MHFINNAPFSRAVILVPIIGYWLILNDHVVKNYADLWVELTSRPEGTPPPRPWQLLMTYFGLCLVAAGSAVYHVFCPSELKRYAGNTDYVAAIVPHISDIEVERVTIALRNGDAQSRRMLIGMVPLAIIREEQKERERRDMLTAHFDLLNRSWFPARVTAFTLDVAGVLTLLVPSVSIFYRVVRLLLS